MCLADPAFGFPSQSCFNHFGLVCCEQNHIQQESQSRDKGKEVEGLIACPQVLMVEFRGDDLRDFQSMTVNDWMSLGWLIFCLLYSLFVYWQWQSNARILTHLGDGQGKIQAHCHDWPACHGTWYQLQQHRGNTFRRRSWLNHRWNELDAIYIFLPAELTTKV